MKERFFFDYPTMLCLQPSWDGCCMGLSGKPCANIAIYRFGTGDRTYCDLCARCERAFYRRYERARNRFFIQQMEAGPPRVQIMGR